MTKNINETPDEELVENAPDVIDDQAEDHADGADVEDAEPREEEEEEDAEAKR